MNASTTLKERRVINLDEVPVTENGNGKSFVAKIGRIAPMLGLTGLGCSLTIVPPGKRAYPFHRHHVGNELFYILAGSGRGPSRWQRPGDPRRRLHRQSGR